MLNIILVESAIETIPRKLRDNPIIIKHAKKVKKEPLELILDVSLHHNAMNNLTNRGKRGRPDILHNCLLFGLNSILNKSGLLRIYIHTIKDTIIKVNPEVRIPRNYNRFIGLMEQLFKYEKVPLKGDYLLKIEKMSLETLISALKPTEVVILTEKGRPKLPIEILERVTFGYSYTIIIGAFARGDFNKRILNISNKKFKIDPEPLDSLIVLSKIINSYENAINLNKKRLFQK
ncbi:MAG: 16S rRNA methyltransferase [Candidatus Helarchaeota archaeon]